MVRTKLKPKRDSLIALTQRYANIPEACVDFFKQAKYPIGFICEKCGSINRSHVIQCKESMHQHYLFAGTIFQDNKLDLYKLILGLYIFFTSTKGISAIELASELDVNYKTALLLSRKCRILMSNSNSHEILDAMFY
ncbi:MAG: transposase [Erysipelotrichaceae bacterium]